MISTLPGIWYYLLAMTQIKPFKAVFYNKEKVEDLSKVVCPPYDVISPQEQNDFHNLHPNNFIHILLGKDRAQDNKTENKYTRAKEIFEKWLKSRVLIEDDQEAIYFYRQEFQVRGEKHGRLGFIALMKLQDPKDSKIYPHEKTHAEAKEDRFRLWSSVKANLSSIFVCFSDHSRKVETIFHRQVASTEPLIDAVDQDGVRHIVWRLADPGSVQEIVDTLSNQQLFIADGHHRYEVAMEYRRQRLERFQNSSRATGQEPFNYVMTYFTNMDSRELQIFPMHRIVKRLPAPLDFLDEFFRIDKIKTKEDLLIMLAKAGRNEHAFGLYTREGIQLLRLKNKSLIDQYVTTGSPEFRSLDAMILKSFVLDRVGVKTEDIVYTKDLETVTGMVDSNQADASFVLNPVPVQQLKTIALNGERMPPKTTYFYPKVLSGLTVYRLDS